MLSDKCVVGSRCVYTIRQKVHELYTLDAFQTISKANRDTKNFPDLKINFSF